MRRARRLLDTYGHDRDASSRELVTWLKTDTPYPNPSNDSLLQSPYLVVHGIVEIAKVEAMGLRMTEHDIVKDMERVNDAHLPAATVEFDVATTHRALDHIRSHGRRR